MTTKDITELEVWENITSEHTVGNNVYINTPITLESIQAAVNQLTRHRKEYIYQLLITASKEIEIAEHMNDSEKDLYSSLQATVTLATQKSMVLLGTKIPTIYRPLEAYNNKG